MTTQTLQSNEIIQTAIFKTDIANSTATHVALQSNANSSINEFASSTIVESTKQNKVREYRFVSDTTEVISLILDIAKKMNDSDFASIYNASMLKVAKRYVRSEKSMTEQKPNAKHPSPCSIFTYFKSVNNSITVFIAKIDLATIFDQEDLLFKNGLPHNEKGEKTKNWKTAKITINIEEKENQTIHCVKNVTLTDTSSSIANYWYDSFLETTEVTDDMKNTNDVYKFFKSTINRHGGKKKNENTKTDIKHFLNQLHGYMINNKTFEYESAMNSIFGDYEAKDSDHPTQLLKEKISTGYIEKKFDKTFNIIHNEIDTAADAVYKISEKITLKVKFIENIEDTVIAKISNTGEPVIEIKVDSTQNKTYQQFLVKDAE